MSTHNFSTFENLNTLFTSVGNKLKEKPTAVKLTQIQYNALSQSEKEDPTKIYYVTDGGSGGASLTFDTIPTSGSSNPVTSDGIYRYIDTMITQALTGSY